MLKRCRRIAATESGAVLIMVAVSSVALLGFLGLAMDVGYMYHYRRLMQTAADAGALAGGAEIERGQATGVVQSSAKTATAVHSFTHGTNSVTVNVHHPPISGSYIGNTKFVEVVISQPLPIFVMKLFGYTNMTIPARAVAGVGGDSKACIYVLDQTREASFQANSSAIVNAACGIVVDSSHGNAMDLNSSSNITASSTAVNGGWTKESSAVITPTPTTGVPRSGDPLAWLDPPTFTMPATNCPTTGNTDGLGYHNRRLINNQTATWDPGVYCGGIWIEGNSILTLNPGMYILLGGQDSSYEKGSLHISGNAKIIGNGVTFYLTETPAERSGWNGSRGKYRPFVTESSSIVQLKAPTTGYYAGILLMDDRSVGECRPDASSPCDKWWTHKLASSTTSYFEGIFYAPRHILTLESSTNTTTAAYSQVIVRQLKLESSTVWNLGTNFSGLPGGSPIKRLTLVE